MKKSHVKWSAILSFLCALMVFLGILFYALVPFTLSVLLGASEDPCAAPAGYGSPSGIQAAMSNLCNTAKSFIGITIMVLIVIASPVIFIANCISSMDVLARPAPKRGWLAAIWLLPGLGNMLYYWLVKRKEP
jgi:hypothetical protein